MTPFRNPLPHWVMALGLVALALLLYAPVMSLSFFSDDFSVIHRIGVRGDLGTGSFFRPLPDWTLFLNYMLAGPAPWAFRIVNVALLGLNGWMLFLLALRIVPTSLTQRKQLIAVIAAVLFVAYPYHSEPQLWIIGRSTAMATFFVLATLLVAVGPMVDWKKILAVGLLSSLGAMCYESALLIPGLLIALLFLAPAKERKLFGAMVVLTGLLVGVNLLLRSQLTGQVANAYGTGFFTRDLLAYAATAAKVFGRLFLSPQPDEQVQLVRFGLLAVVIGTLLIVLHKRTVGDHSLRKSFIVLTALVVVACIIAIVGGVSTRTSESDRFLYLPSAFLCLFIAMAVPVLFTGWRQWAFTAVLLLVCIVQLMRGQAHWRNASQTIDRIVTELPTTPITGRLLVNGIPSDDHGAFVFRHGFTEALYFGGRSNARVLQVDTIITRATTNESLGWSFEHPEDSTEFRPSDRLVQWTASGFRDVVYARASN